MTPCFPTVDGGAEAQRGSQIAPRGEWPGGVVSGQVLGVRWLMPVTALLLQRFGTVLEALEKGQPVDLSGMPPAPEGQSDNGGICLGWD